MKWKITNPQARLYLISAIVLLVGLGSAAFIYLTAANNPDSLLDYEDSKMYIHDLELYGGKANILMSRFMSWFASLWHGKSLALTVAFITIFISFVVFLIAGNTRSESNPDVRDDENAVGR